MKKQTIPHFLLAFTFSLYECGQTYVGQDMIVQKLRDYGDKGQFYKRRVSGPGGLGS